MEGEIGDDQARTENVLEDLLRDHPRLGHLVCTHHGELQAELVDGWLDDLPEQQVGVLALLAPLLADGRDVETSLVEVAGRHGCDASDRRDAGWLPDPVAA